MSEKIVLDGNLGADGDAKIQYGAAFPAERGIYIIDMDSKVYLNAQQALSLLAWLRQEESTLEELAKEQEQP